MNGKGPGRLLFLKMLCGDSSEGQAQVPTGSFCKNKKFWNRSWPKYLLSACDLQPSYAILYCMLLFAYRVRQKELTQ